MIVLDTSAIIEMARNTEVGVALRELMCPKERAVSCDLARAEIASVCRKLTRTEGITPEHAQRLFAECLELVDEFYPIADLQAEALGESIRLNHSTYDMFYFVLARRTGGTLFTADRKLMELSLSHGVNCIYQITDLLVAN